MGRGWDLKWVRTTLLVQGHTGKKLQSDFSTVPLMSYHPVCGHRGWMVIRGGAEMKSHSGHTKAIKMVEGGRQEPEDH